MKTFQEKLYEHHSQVFTVDAVLYCGQTKFQEASFLRTGFSGAYWFLMVLCS